MLVAEQALEREIDGLLLFELEEATWREMGMVGSTGTQSPETVAPDCTCLIFNRKKRTSPY